jgi:signal transduction histidine kinase
MRSRAAEVGGRLTIESTGGGDGTRIILDVPDPSSLDVQA